jgi:hydroxymethylpyrimidine/phosphomethylpyrimidine kinase
MTTALTIAGSDSGAGAGIQADLKTFAAHGVYGTSVITSVTAQNTRGITAVFPLPTDVISAQIEAVVVDIGPDATKIGMLSTATIVEAVAAAIDRLKLPRVVVDPVMIATSGERLLDESGLAALRAELLPRAFVVTPNISEAEVLAGMSIETTDDAIEAARRIHSSGVAAVIVKGGHLPTPDAVDVVFDGRAARELRGPRLETRHTHGTGCTFASAVAANLALGRSLVDAAAEAKAYVFGAMRRGVAVGHGSQPLDHFWRGAGQPAERLY